MDPAFRTNGHGPSKHVVLGLSGSMSPLIEINDRVLVKKVNPFEIRSKDIILFKDDDVLVTHRVVNFSRNDGKTMILQKGDVSNHASLISTDTVMGKVKLSKEKASF